MIKPTSNTNQSAPQPIAATTQTAAARAAIAIAVTEVEYDTTNPAWVTFDAAISGQLADLESQHTGLTTPLSLAKTFEKSRR